MFTFPMTMMSGAAGYPVPAVNFDGTNDYLTRGAGMTGAADSTMCTGSFWIKGNTGELFQGDLTRFRALCSVSVFRLRGRGTTGTNILEYDGATTLSTSAWQHVLFSYDLSDTGKRHVYINDVTDGGAWTTYTNATQDFTESDYAIGANTGGTSKFNGDMAEFWFEDGVYIDFSNSANRRLFISAAGKPVNLGTTGQTPTGSSPLIYLHNSLATWETNLGSGGGFTENGALSAAATSPSD